MKAIILLFLGLVSAHKINRGVHYRDDVEDALVDFEDGDEDVDSNSATTAYYVQLA